MYYVWQKSVRIKMITISYWRMAELKVATVQSLRIKIQVFKYQEIMEHVINVTVITFLKKSTITIANPPIGPRWMGTSRANYAAATMGRK